jgi:hypothetical protein
MNSIKQSMLRGIGIEASGINARLEFDANPEEVIAVFDEWEPGKQEYLKN